ncbi:DNA cytosine methyltransferase [Thalassospira marina]|uniref:DNA (cytosine-5-)-methyltransferase n=1 Tax=Thalassospira marina TaxID=2048283 RepID=A0ABN5FLM5_9PROT|nr:DNA cytosine methyltransferase [Thalassospira marina]AUG55275.1 DNA (cytosine-5-)-methyltransferase [Thalassospira marina]
MKLRTLDLFCGGGGSAWGAQAAGAEIVCGIDAWDLAAQTFEANFGSARGVNLCLDESSGSKLVPDLGPIDLILASPECTNHTCAKGGRPRDEGSKMTARYVLNFAKDLSPRWIVLENVVHMRSWRGYDPLICELEDLGYNVLPQVLDASNFGVPQKRRRLFLLCDRDKNPSPIVTSEYPVGTVESDVIIWEGAWKSKPLYNERRAQATLERAERAIEMLGRGVPFLIVYYGSDGSGGWQPLDRPIRTLTTLDRFGLVTWEGDTPMLRMLQPPELQKAMGFGENYKMPFGSRRDHIKILGNGVCPPVMNAIIRSLTGSEQLLKAAE